MGTKTIWDGDDLPPVGMAVLIHLASCNAWVPHIVTGYRIDGDLGGNPRLHRIFINLAPSDHPWSSKNERMLSDVRPVDWAEGLVLTQEEG